MKKPSTPLLFQPLALLDTVIRNRIWIPPMCQYSVEKRDGVPTSWHLMHYGSLARGGAGLVTVEATGVVPEGRITPQCMGIWNDEQALAFKAITDLIRSQGATPAIQLAHAGRKASTLRPFPGEPQGNAPLDEGGWTPVAPSSIPFPGLGEPVQLDQAGIQDVISAFVAGAKRAVAVGFEVLEIHGAHGYLLHEFLSPLSNLRDDEYGGDLKGRARLVREVTRKVRAAVGPKVPIIVRLSGTEWVEDGLGIDQVVQVAKWLKDDGADLISVSSAGNTAHAPIPLGPGYQVPLSKEIRDGAQMPTAVAGLITTPTQAEQILADGDADAVYIGRRSLREPNFPVLAARELGADPQYIPPQYHRAYL